MRPKLKTQGLVIQAVENETLIYDLESNKAFCLNITASLVWNACNGSRSITEIKESLQKDVDESVNEDLIHFTLDQLNKKGLIEGYESVPFAPKRVSRRKVVQSFGLSAAVSLPIIASLVAPPALAAQSGCIPAQMNPSGCPCVNPSDCAGGSCGMGTAGICD